MLKEAIRQGVNELHAVVFSPPYYMTLSGSVSGSKLYGHSNLKRKDEHAFASYMIQVCISI